MAQIEDPLNLARFTNPDYRLVTLILIRAGLRVTDAVRLPRDCVVTDADGTPYLLRQPQDETPGPGSRSTSSSTP